MRDPQGYTLKLGGGIVLDNKIRDSFLMLESVDFTCLVEKLNTIWLENILLVKFVIAFIMQFLPSRAAFFCILMYVGTMCTESALNLGYYSELYYNQCETYF